MRVGEVSARTGVSVRAIRYYEAAGLLQAVRQPNGYREFDPASVDRVRAIRDLLDTGFTIDEIVSLSECLPDVTGTRPCRTQTVALYRSKLEKIDGQVHTLLAVRGRIEARLATLKAS
jgi:DNA-binding transcriptional MerR regulator